jgi:hypothetical protein
VLKNTVLNASYGQLSSIIDKTQFLQFYTKINQNNEFQIVYENKQITMAQNTKFLGLTID